LANPFFGAYPFTTAAINRAASLKV
jgi:hypothetical protein